MGPPNRVDAGPSAGGRPDSVHLSWTRDPSTSLTVAWHTASGGSPGLVEYRKRGTEGLHVARAAAFRSPGDGFLHRATMVDLDPDTEYEYRASGDAGPGPSASPFFRTRTAPPPGQADFHFAFLADTGLIGRRDGNATGTRQVMDEIARDEPLLILGGGDYAYGNRDGRFDRMADAVDAWFLQTERLLARFPFMAQYGNHEIFLEERFEDWAPHFAHPPGFPVGAEAPESYSFEVADVHFTAFFVPGPPPGEDAIAWLDEDLSRARERGARWLVVFQHEPVFGHGRSHPAKPEVRAALAPVFERNRVDLHLSCHDQNYERTFPLVDVPGNPRATSKSTHEYEAGSGVVYAKVSPGGKMSEIGDDFSRFTTDRQPFMAVREDSRHHYAVVSVKACGRLEVETFSLVGDGSPKELLDSFALVARS